MRRTKPARLALIKMGLHKSAGACARRSAPRTCPRCHPRPMLASHARARALAPTRSVWPCRSATSCRAVIASCDARARTGPIYASLFPCFRHTGERSHRGAGRGVSECSPCVAVWHKASHSAGRRCGCLRWITTRWPVRRAVRSLVQLHASKPPACMLALTRVAHWTCAARPRRVQQRPGHRSSDCPAQPARDRRCDLHRESWRPRLRRLHFRLRLGQSTAAAVCRVCLSLVWTLFTLCRDTIIFIHIKSRISGAAPTAFW
jgi:hypothetical protein